MKDGKKCERCLKEKFFTRIPRSGIVRFCKKIGKTQRSYIPSFTYYQVLVLLPSQN